ncbi:tenascin [Mytilus galloprovincialis]|uniref:Tenascin n=2 Tax=Mytilus galloprovincialis TaxID=29158 RepID=A0A8B6FUH9_MYTGA|nr:tenascin [Mytilus galloprovincialis]
MMVKKSVQLVICLLSLLTVELCSAANVDEACTGNTDCTVANSECSSGTCKCVGTTHYKSSATVCTPRGAFGGVCVTSIGDSTCLHSLKCTSNTCQCTTPTSEFFDTTDNTCKAKGGFGGVCVTSIGDSTCLYSLKCTSNTCQCTTPANQFFDTSDNTCKAKITLEATCTTGPTDQCLDVNAECKADTNNANKCLCKTTHYKDSNDACVDKIALEATCTPGITDQCLDASAECKADTDSTNKCLCKSTHYKHTNGICVGKSGFEGVCVTTIGDSSCLYSLKCISDTCQCTTPASEFFDSTDNTCKAKIALEATCTPGSTDQCKDTSAECKTDTDTANKCLCKTTHYKDSNDACAAKGGFGGVCVTATGDSTCLYSLKCTTDTCQCATPVSQFFDSTAKTCKPKIALNMECTIETDKPCADPMAVCTQHGSGPNKCMCNSDSYPSSDKCVARKLHNINCMENGHVNECVENAECKKVNNEFKCQCKNGAEENGKCNGVTVITPNFLLTIVCLIVTIVYKIQK